MKNKNEKNNKRRKRKFSLCEREKITIVSIVSLLLKKIFVLILIIN